MSLLSGRGEIARHSEEHTRQASQKQPSGEVNKPEGMAVFREKGMLLKTKASNTRSKESVLNLQVKLIN